MEPAIDLEGLVAAARAGDADAFAAVYEALAPRVHRYLRYRVPDPDQAEELLQQVFLQMIAALPRFEPRGLPFAAWVFRIARNAVIDAGRARRPSLPIELAHDVPSEVPGPDELAVAGDEQAGLRDALGRLPRDQHDVLVYRFYGGLSPREVAPLMDRSEGAVRVLQHRALGALRRLLEEAGAGRPRAGDEA
ncbi:MAG: sigma-70 family RNA polymerase sigma factor [Chloroflexi bacterium]|jgi:RNA polymerase sigma-70 factor (ECF subfamily)|nr:sigma-70 family RNA polymerase sigma factor [Chloroflexota bacterium]